MMKRIVMNLTLLIMLMSCAGFKKPEKTKQRLESPKKTQTLGALWQLITPEYLIMYFRHQSNKSLKKVKLNSLTQADLGPGKWRFVGLEFKDDFYKPAYKGGGIYSLQIRPKTLSYVGTIILECPTAGNHHLTRLKEMRFFHRLPVISKTKTCELIIGSDLSFLKASAQKLDFPIPENIGIGF